MKNQKIDFEKSTAKYNFRDEMYYYCSSDVNILRKGCIKFSQLMNESGNVSPFYDTTCITIASLALKIIV